MTKPNPPGLLQRIEKIQTLTGNIMKIGRKDEFVLFIQQYNHGQMNNIFFHQDTIKTIINKLTLIDSRESGSPANAELVKAPPCSNGNGDFQPASRKVSPTPKDEGGEGRHD